MTDPTAPTPEPHDLARRLAGIEDTVGMTYGFMQGLDAELGQMVARQNFDHRLIVAIEETQRDHTRALAALDRKIGALDAKLDARFAEVNGGLKAITNLLGRLLGEDESGAGGAGGAGE